MVHAWLSRLSDNIPVSEIWLRTLATMETNTALYYEQTRCDMHKEKELQVAIQYCMVVYCFQAHKSCYERRQQ